MKLGARAYFVFIKHLVSYLLLLIIPITVLTLVVNSQFVDKLQQEVISGNLNSLDKVQSAMDDQLKWIDDMTRQLLTEDNSFTPFLISDHWGYKTWGITRELKRFQRLSPFIHEIWLYYKDEKSVFTSSGVYTVPVLVNQIYRFGDMREKELLSYFNSPDKMTVLKTATDQQSGKKYVRIFVPLYPNQKHSDGTLVYLIEEAAIQQLMSAYDESAGSTLIFDQSGQFISGIQPESGPPEQAVRELVQHGGLADNQKVELGGKPYYLFFMESAVTGWKYTTLLPVNQVLRKVEQAQQWYLYGVAALVLIGGSLIYASMLLNYRPIHRLRKESMQVWSDPDRNLNELDTVRDVLQLLVRHNNELDRHVKEGAPAARNRLFVMLLKGDYEQIDEVLDYGKKIGFPGIGGSMRVVIVQLPAQLEANRLPSIAQMEGLFPGNGRVYGVEHFEADKVIFFLGGITGVQEAEETLQSFREALYQLTSCPVTVGAGAEASLTDIPQSYLEAQTALGYRFVQGVNRVIMYERITRSAEQAEYPVLEADELQRAIREGDADSLSAHLSFVLSYIRTVQPPLIVARGLCFEMIRLINGMWRELGLQEESRFGRYPDIFSLAQLDTLDEFEGLITAVSADLCGIFSQKQCAQLKKPPAAHCSVEAIEAYINAHYDSCEFTLQHMADHFGMALPNVSQLFKDKSGQTLLEYMTMLRMEKAKTLLGTTQLQLKAVAEEVGYYNASSFIRRFKQLTGVTPGEYRSSCQKAALQPGNSDTSAYS
ncbi:helix-turn-helix domain-containing protein [Paenibacillus camerounensis]|uniref:helix-turn-helix domain-containing protein n=1 Tax=Paenibacillus camerounensis TaxID=1243663 RepID=UPI000694BDD0|nr:helix-turn-helix domain-containing protein [Paenibacillus camerounensis]